MVLLAVSDVVEALRVASSDWPESWEENPWNADSSFPFQEHHLQAVLSAAATRHHAYSRSTRGAEKDSAPAAYIPTPDSNGKVENHEELYPPNKWRDPITYVKSSDSVEEATSFALANGFIYYMDERDKEWLDKNNEEARGEGPSKRVSRKGKEPETVSMSEDEFELVMAMYEKITHEKAEFLHHVSILPPAELMV